MAQIKRNGEPRKSGSGRKPVIQDSPKTILFAFRATTQEAEKINARVVQAGFISLRDYLLSTPVPAPIEVEAKSIDKPVKKRLTKKEKQDAQLAVVLKMLSSTSGVLKDEVDEAQS